MNNTEKIIEQLELDYIEFTGKSLEQKKKILPLKEPRQIKSLIWNLLNSEKYRKQISYNDYSDVFDILVGRLNN